MMMRRTCNHIVNGESPEHDAGEPTIGTRSKPRFLTHGESQSSRPLQLEWPCADDVPGVSPMPALMLVVSKLVGTSVE